MGGNKKIDQEKDATTQPRCSGFPTAKNPEDPVW